MLWNFFCSCTCDELIQILHNQQSDLLMINEKRINLQFEFLCFGDKCNLVTVLE